MTGFTLSGGFHFDPTGEGVAPAGITARGIGGMTFTPPPPPPPSYEAYTYKAIEQIFHRSDQVGSDGDTVTATGAQENDVMIISANGYTTTSYAPVPSGWTEVPGSKINANAVPGYGVSHIAYYKICDDSGTHEFEIEGMAGETIFYSGLVLRNLRVTGGPNTSPIGDVKTRSGINENYAATDLDVENTTSTDDDGTSWVLWSGQYEFGHRTMYGRGLGGTLLQSAGGSGGSKIYRDIVKGQSDDVDAYARYIPSATVWTGGSPRTPRYIGVSIELVARPGHTGGPWPSSLEQPE